MSITTTQAPALPITSEFINEIAALMRIGDVSRTQLAHRMGLDAGAVAEMLSGNPELLTDAALERVAKVLNATWIVSLVPNGDIDAYPRPA